MYVSHIEHENPFESKIIFPLNTLEYRFQDLSFNFKTLRKDITSNSTSCPHPKLIQVFKESINKMSSFKTFLLILKFYLSNHYQNLELRRKHLSKHIIPVLGLDFTFKQISVQMRFWWFSFFSLASRGDTTFFWYYLSSDDIGRRLKR